MMQRPLYAPETFAGKPITFAIPYNMPGEILLGPNQTGVQFPDATFSHNVDKPFEIWRMIPRLTAFDTSDPPVMLDVQPATLDKRVRLSINDLSKNERMNKNPTLVNAFLKENTHVWDWDPRPYTIVRSEGFQIVCDSLAFPAVCAPAIVPPGDPCALVSTPVGFVRIEVNFQGFLLIIGPPSETR